MYFFVYPLGRREGIRDSIFVCLGKYAQIGGEAKEGGEHPYEKDDFRVGSVYGTINRLRNEIGRRIDESSQINRGAGGYQQGD